LLNTSTILDDAFQEHLQVIQALVQQKPVLESIAAEMARTIIGNHKILWCGNGGSAADSQHLAAELVGRFRRERKGLPSIALTTDTSVLTCVGNDYGFEQVFSRQVEALCSRQDVLVGITTSGNSPNVCCALQAARDIGALTVAFTGERGGKAADIADLTLRVPSNSTARIQEGHILCGHILCDWIEASFVQAQTTTSEPGKL
jgi:D-sedoheptulose 7-phosphate isomerase